MNSKLADRSRSNMRGAQRRRSSNRLARTLVAARHRTPRLLVLRF